MEKFRFRKKETKDAESVQLKQQQATQSQQQQDQTIYQTMQLHPNQNSYKTAQLQSEQTGHKTAQLRPEQSSYLTTHLHPRYTAEPRKMKQHTNWSGLMQDLFGMDSPQTAESTHESTSSGVASDVTSVYPSTTTMTTFKGGESTSSACSAKSIASQDSGTKSASLSSSPKPEQMRQHLRGTRMSPAPPLPPLPYDPPPPLPAKHPLRITNASPQVDQASRVNTYTESPVNPSRGKKIRERKVRASEHQLAQTNNELNGWTQVKSVHPQRSNTCYTCNTSDHRIMDSCMANEINGPFVEAMKDEHYIDGYGDIRFIESHIHQDVFIHRDRLNTVPSPVSPVPPGGYYYNRDTALSQQQPDQWLGEMVTRDTKLRHKHLQQQPIQQHHQLQQYHQQFKLPQHQHPHQHLTSATFRTSSPVHCETSALMELQSDPVHPHPSNNRHDRATPTGHTSRPGSAMTNGNTGRQMTNSRTIDQVGSLNPKPSNVFQTKAQIHHSGQIEDRSGRADGRVKLTNGHLEAELNIPQANNFKATGLVGGVKNLSISQTEVCPAKNLALSSKGKKHMSRSSLFECLPNELLLKIFFHLPTDQLCRCAQVCRQWYHAVWDNPVLWTSIVINNPNIDIDRALKYLTRRLSYNTPKICMILEKININFCSRLTDRGLQTAVKRCPELRYLDMQGCHLVTNEGVTEAVSRCVNLERLDVTDCPQITCISLMDSVLAQSPSNHLERIYLRYLDMTDCPHVTDQDLFIITSQCTQLLFFYLRRCPLISDLGVSYIANNCSSLRELSMSDCLNITDLAMRELAKLRDNLRYLSVAKCEKVSDEGVINIAKNCSKLRYLNVRGCEAVSDIGLEFLARNCPRLRSLDIGKCDITDEGLFALARYCPHLRKLGVKSCDAITDKGIVLVAYSCNSLQQLHVQDCCLSADAYAMVRKYCKRAIIEHTNPAVL